MAGTKQSYTAADLAKMPDDGRRYELVKGELLVSPAPIREHQWISIHLSEFFMRAYRAGYGHAYTAPSRCFFLTAVRRNPI